MSNLDQYVIRDVNGMAFPMGDTIASIGWVQLEIPDKSKREEGEHSSIPTPAVCLASPNFGGLERLLKALEIPKETLKVRLDTKWEPAPKRITLSFYGSDRVEGAPPPALLIPPITVQAAESDPEERYERARRYAYENPLFLFQLIDSLTGTTQNTVLRRLPKGSKVKGSYGREYTATGNMSGSLK